MERISIQDISKILNEKNGIGVNFANSFVAEMFDIIRQRLSEEKLVKVKGLGTFKIISVDSRESVSVRTGERVTIASHEKVTFTPDAVIRELVNKPFSQFDTVILNDGVQFDDLSDDLTPEEIESYVETETEPTFIPPIVEEPQPIVEEPQPIIEVVEDENITVEPEQPEEVQPMIEVVDEQIEEPVVVPEEPIVVPEEPIVVPEEPTVVPEEPAGVEEESFEDDDEPAVEEPILSRPTPHKLVEGNDDFESYPWYRWLMPVIFSSILIVLAGVGGYYLGLSNATVALSDTIIIRDTVVAAEPVDSLEEPDSLLAMEMEEEGVQEASAQSAPVPAQKPVAATEEPQKKPAAKEATVTVGDDGLDEYERKDERVRLGAYRIIGEDHRVTVQPGQTFYSICRAHLGPDMNCYVEVFNNLPRDPQIKEGQVIRIPKLQWKKRRK